MMDLPWWTFSPSPFSFLFYFILSLYAYHKLRLYEGPKTFRQKIGLYTDTIFLVGAVVLFLDGWWIIICGLRFLPMFPDSIIQLFFSGARDFVGVIFCLMFVGHYFLVEGFTRIKRITIVLFIVDLIFLIVWFALSPSPAYTDWTYAIKNNYPMETIIISFLTSHILGKTIAATIFLSIW